MCFADLGGFSTVSPSHEPRDTAQRPCIENFAARSSAGSGAADAAREGTAGASGGGNGAAAGQECKDSYRRSGGKELATAGDDVDIEPRYKLEFTVSEACMAKVEKAKSLLSGKHRRGVTFELMLEAMLDAFIDRHDPERRAERVYGRGFMAAHYRRE